MEPESLNHLYAIIAVAAFLYCRINFSEHLEKADALPIEQKKIREGIEKIIEDIRREINLEINDSVSIVRPIIKNVNKEVIDFESDYQKQLWTRLQKKSVKQLESFDDEIDKRRDLKFTFLRRIDDRFKNIFFLLALSSFSFLVLAARHPLFQESTTNFLTNYLFIYNTLFSLAVIAIILFSKNKKIINEDVMEQGQEVKKKKIKESTTHNTRVIFFFFSSLIASWFLSKYLTNHQIELCHFFATHTSYDSKCFVLTYSMMILIIPWIIYFVFHTLNNWWYWVLSFLCQKKYNSELKKIKQSIPILADLMKLKPPSDSV